MNLNYKLKLFTAIVCFGIIIGSVNAQSSTITKSSINAENSDNWVMVQNENGINIYLKEEVLPEGRFIAIKFANTTKNKISFSWELSLNGKQVQKSTSKLTLKQKSSEVFFDPTVMVKLKDNQSVNQFSITTL